MHVSLKEKCKLSWDRVFGVCKSLDAARGQHLPRGRVGWWLGADKVAAILSLEDRGGERGVKYVTTTMGAVGGARVDGNTGSGSA